MKTILISNKKGGVGKTTIAKGFGEYIAEGRGKRVLYIDLDLQCNLSCRILDMENKTPNSSGIDWVPPVHPDYSDIYEDIKNSPQLKNWSGRGSSADIFRFGWTVPYSTANPLIEIIPAHSKELETIELQEQEKIKKKIIDIFVRFINLYKDTNQYDYCILDTSPKTGPVIQAAMHASDYVIMPCIPEKMAVEGIRGQISTMYMVNQHRPSSDKLKIAAIVVNKLKKARPVHKKNYAYLRSNKDVAPLLLGTYMRDLQGYAMSTEYDSPLCKNEADGGETDLVDEENVIHSIFELPNSNEAKKEFTLVCEELWERING